MTVSEYRPAGQGDWLVVTVGTRVIAVRGDGAQQERTQSAEGDASSVDDPSGAGASPLDVRAFYAAGNILGAVDLLTAHGFGRLRDFVIVEQDARGVQLLHRGPTPLWVERTGAVVERRDAGDVLGWTEIRLTDVDRIICGVEPDESLAEARRGGFFPLGDGAVWADAFVVSCTPNGGSGADGLADGAEEIPAAGQRPLASGAGRTGSAGAAAGARRGADEEDEEDLARTRVEPLTPADGVSLIRSVPDSGESPQSDTAGTDRRRDSAVGASHQGRTPLPLGSAVHSATALAPASASASVRPKPGGGSDGTPGSSQQRTLASVQAGASGGDAVSGHGHTPRTGPHSGKRPGVSSTPIRADGGNGSDAEQGSSDSPGSAATVTPRDAAVSVSPVLDRIREGEHDGNTQISTHLRSARGEARRKLARERPRYALILPGGTRRAIDDAVIIGRAPSAPPSADGVLPQLISVEGDDISRSHIRVSVEGGTVVVTDLHSSNGTRVLSGDKPPLSLRAGEATPIIAGSAIDLGGVELRVEVE